MIFPAELETERLLLRQWRDDDVDALYEIYTQPEFLRFMPALDRDGTARQIESFRGRWQSDGFCLWAADDKASGTFVGRIGVQRHRDWPLEPHNPVEVGWTLHRDWWGTGLATEGGRAATQCWYDLLLDEPRLLSITRPDNTGSRAVMQRLGFTFRGQTSWRAFDHVWYAIDRDTWRG
ncbi:MAG: GNAT family N-acetyltransferase [Mycobacteriales bacterium]